MDICVNSKFSNKIYFDKNSKYEYKKELKNYIKNNNVNNKINIIMHKKYYKIYNVVNNILFLQLPKVLLNIIYNYIDDIINIIITFNERTNFDRSFNIHIHDQFINFKKITYCFTFIFQSKDMRVHENRCYIDYRHDNILDNNFNCIILFKNCVEKLLIFNQFMNKFYNKKKYIN